jgi:hypothetical protein
MKPGFSLDKEAFAAWLDTKTEHYKVPKSENIIELPSLPRSEGVGKIKRGELKAMISEN